MSSPVDSVSFSNISATPPAFDLKGGYYMLSGVGTWGGGNIELKLLGPDASTYLSLPTALKLSANGTIAGYLPPALTNLSSPRRQRFTPLLQAYLSPRGKTEMVQAVIDPIRVPTITLSEEELTELHEQIAAGQLPPDFLIRHENAKALNVFGHDAIKNRDGSFREQGLGSEFGMTRNSINAYKKFGKEEQDFEKNVARMEKQLVAANERRKQAAAK
jgi:hypothetical protein